MICSGYGSKYAMFGQFSIKSNVFSFGELILEIVHGQKITSFCNGENMEYLLNYVSLIIKRKKKKKKKVREREIIYGNLNKFFL